MWRFWNVHRTAFDSGCQRLRFQTVSDDGKLKLDMTLGGVGPTRKLLESSDCTSYPRWIEKGTYSSLA